MGAHSRIAEISVPHLAASLVSLRQRAGLTQTEVARRMGTTQTAIARLESGHQSPTMNTLQKYARATGFCLEIGFVQAVREPERTGCILVVASDGEVGEG